VNETTTPQQPAQCRRCKRHNLRTPASRAAGIGPRCAAIEAAFDGLDDRQQAKAREALEDSAVIPTGRKGIVSVVSEDGEAVHLVSLDGHCSCPHGARRMTATAKTCWHVGAAKLAMAPRRPAGASRFILAA
jgi:hypothetical protein